MSEPVCPLCKQSFKDNALTSVYAKTNIVTLHGVSYSPVLLFQ